MVAIELKSSNATINKNKKESAQSNKGVGEDELVTVLFRNLACHIKQLYHIMIIINLIVLVWYIFCAIC